MPLLDLTVDSSNDVIQTIADHVDSVAERQGWTQKVVFALQVSLDEWVSNVVKYSYGGEKGQPIRVLIDEDRGELIARVEDFGAPFDPSTSDIPSSLDDTLSGKREGGMGLFVMHHLLSGIDFERSNERNIVILRVKL